MTGETLGVAEYLDFVEREYLTAGQEHEPPAARQPDRLVRQEGREQVRVDGDEQVAGEAAG